MSRINQCFKDLKANGQTALIPYVTAGDPEPWVTVPLLHALVDAGADIIELGVPFSDPSSDGPVIQKACERALQNDVSLNHVLEMVKQFRDKNQTTPIVLMGYANPIEAYGYEAFAEKASVVGVDGVLTVDMPPEESDLFREQLEKHEIDTIFLVAPTTSEQRMKLIAQHARGFIYYVSIKGVTGTAALNVDEVSAKLSVLRNVTALPLGVGFGIRDGKSAAAVSEVADAVVVGSTLVRCIEEHANRPQELPAAVAAMLAEMRHAINARDLASA
ncbi:Tryptophan synthase alpha chain [Methylophaga frappieri]|uniref:Tryptophan synthase alpha chain n=1 Tax=Methylophaga frappieri (strain ATCC BAA-2434 / DSM 25690 / JAM7) TaxID=754477 RepID=I1YL55_METFJ|nr:tryptophan synthase subunit alpha [Methylophaga frappieri]AFJ03648.1 Tryptophan synthase alpha chain [Methylophaga frappieri]